MANSEIITSKHYPAYILASAGTGKTELIARKVENLIINEGVDIDKIALITFTNKATAETTARIKSKLYNIWKSGNNEIRSQIDKISMAKISTRIYGQDRRYRGIGTPSVPLHRIPRNAGFRRSRRQKA